MRADGSNRPGLIRRRSPALGMRLGGGKTVGGSALRLVGCEFDSRQGRGKDSLPPRWASEYWGLDVGGGGFETNPVVL